MNKTNVNSVLFEAINRIKEESLYGTTQSNSYERGALAGSLLMRDNTIKILYNLLDEINCGNPASMQHESNHSREIEEDGYITWFLD